jgi:hypothetical protein
MPFHASGSEISEADFEADFEADAGDATVVMARNKSEDGSGTTTKGGEIYSG